MPEISPKLLDILVCPVSACRGPLAHDPGGERLKCTRCGRTYRIETSWPVLIPEEADPQSAASA